MDSTAKKIVLIGAGGLAAEMIEVIKRINDDSDNMIFDIQGFVVEPAYYKGNVLYNGYPVLGTVDWLLERKNEVEAICAVGIPSERSRIQKDLTVQGVRFCNVVDPRATIAGTAEVGSGVYISGGSSVSTYCEIGDGVLLNGEVIIGHDAIVGSYTCIMTRSDVGGRCSIGEEVLVGAHAYIVPDRKIGNGAKIAAGSVVFTNVKSNTTMIGNPARRMKCLEE